MARNSAVKRRDGFWIEVRTKGSNGPGIVLVRNSHEEMMRTVRLYQITKDVNILGEFRKGKKVESKPTVKSKVKS